MYSIMISLKGQKVTIIGGGKVAYRKACLLQEEDCKLQVIAPHFIEAFSTLDAKVSQIKKPYEEGDCKGSLLVFAATDNAALNETIGRYCQKQGILCNIVDNPNQSSFATPAQLKRGDLTISVSTGGKSPSLAAKIKEDLAKQYDDSYAKKIELLGEIRDYILKTEKDSHERKKILNEVSKLNEQELVVYLEEVVKNT